MRGHASAYAEHTCTNDEPGTDGPNLLRYQAAPGEARLPAEAIRKTPEKFGYRADRVRPDDDCYEARAMNDGGIPIAVPPPGHR
jgi:hypothetical protein